MSIQYPQIWHLKHIRYIDATNINKREHVRSSYGTFPLRGKMFMRSHQNATSDKQIMQNGCIEEHLTLGPQEGTELPLGVFEAAVPTPEFAIEYQPSISESGISASLKRIEQEGEYQLLYFFQNFTEETYRVTIRECL